MANNVKHVDFNGKLNHKVMLRELADDDRLKSITVICEWNNKTITVGWSNMCLGSVAIGALKIQQELLSEYEAE